MSYCFTEDKSPYILFDFHFLKGIMKCCELLTCYVLIEFFIMLTAVNLITHGNQVYEGTTCSFFFHFEVDFPNFGERIYN